jgi:hypothetical protein
MEQINISKTLSLLMRIKSVYLWGRMDAVYVEMSLILNLNKLMGSSIYEQCTSEVDE